MNVVSVYQAVAAAHPDQTAIVFDDRSLSYEQLMAQVGAVAGGLKAMRLQPGERLLLFAENSPEYMVALFAAARLGAITATANPAFRGEELAYILDSSRPSIALVQPSLRRVLEAALRESGQRPAWLEIDQASGSIPAITGLPPTAPILADAVVSDDWGLLISYTSGTSSRPKAVFHSHGGQAFAARTHAAIWHLGPGDRVLNALPLAWMYGLATITLSALAAGSTVVLLSHFNPVRALDELVRHRITVFSGVTTMFLKLLQAADESPTRSRTNHLRLCLSGGEPRNEAAFARFRERFGVPIHDIYATSEILPLLTLDPLQDPEPRPGSAGKLAPGAEARILDAAGHEVPVGEIGELFARSPGQLLGYYEDPERTAEVLVDGWFRTNDLFARDAEGYFYMAGRASDLIVRGGANVSPLEVEHALSRHPAVDECAVVRAPDPVYGQRVVAFVVLRDGASASAAELIEHCARSLAAFKVPSAVEFLAELPKGVTTGKTLRASLAARLA